MWRVLSNTVRQIMDVSMSAFTTEEHEATVRDVLQVKALLQQASERVIPLEVIDIIIDFAEYWPHTSNICQKSQRDAYWSHNEADRARNRFTCRSLPLGYVPLDSNDAFLSPDSNFSTQLPFAAFPKVNPDLEVKRAEILRSWASKSTPRGEHPCRKIVFTLRSHDQGWGGDVDDRGTYHGSFTWFDVGLERFEIHSGEVADLPLVGELEAEDKGRDEPKGSETLYTLRTIQPPTKPSEINPEIPLFKHPFLASDACLQYNRAATGKTKEHVVTWSYNDDVDPMSAEGEALANVGRGRASATGDFVRNLKVGDIVTVWARARFPGWKNYVEDVKVDVYWAV